MKKVFSLFALLMVINLFAQENKLDTDREVQACNLVTQYLCILEDLQGRGYVRVRKELQENIKTRKLQKETERLIRGLADACDLAESTLQDVEYTKEDSGDASAVMWGEHIGFTGVASLALGDPTPLIMGVSQAVLQQNKLSKEKRRAIDIQMRPFNQMLNRWHMELNERRSDLIDEYDIPANYFITKTAYKEFIKAVSEDTNEKSLQILRKITLSYPKFREGWYFYGKKLFDNKQYNDAKSAFQNILDQKSKILINDGVRGKGLTLMSFCDLFSRNYENALQSAENAIKLTPSYADPYIALALSSSKLKKHDKALDAINIALTLSPHEKLFYFHKAHILLNASYDQTEILKSVTECVNNGMSPTDFEKDASDAMRSFMKKDIVIDAIAPTVNLSLKYGFFDDDVIIINNSSYTLTNLNVSIKIIGKHCNFEEKNGRVSNSITIKKLKPNQKYTFSDAFSIRDDGQVYFAVVYSSDQTPVKWLLSSYNNVKKRYNGDLSEETILGYLNSAEKGSAEAIEKLRNNAFEGNKTAQYYLGVCYENGFGGSQDKERSFAWYKMAGYNGNAIAQYKVGICYLYGKGTSKDFYNAKKWLSRAASQGHSEAQKELSSLE